MVAQQPEVRVGTAPEGAPEVYIAPQHKVGNKKGKGKGKAKDGEDDEGESTEASLHFIADAASKSLDELKAEYGDALRIAVDPQRSFVAITGSHIRVYAPLALL
jgi:oxalate---CoA ligase